MIKYFLKLIILNRKVARILIKPTLIMHSKLYNLAGRLAIILEGGVHPKHRIMKYKEWFLENIKPNWVVLDIGCDKGLMAFLMAEKAKIVYGIDINEKAIKEANQRKKERLKMLNLYVLMLLSLIILLLNQLIVLRFQMYLSI